MGFTQAALSREAARPKGALGALEGPCAPPCLRRAEGFRVHLCLEPGPPDNRESFQVLRPGTECQNLCVWFTDPENVPRDATFQAILT